MLIDRSLIPPIGYFHFGLILPWGTWSAFIVNPLHSPVGVVGDGLAVVVVAKVINSHIKRTNHKHIYDSIRVRTVMYLYIKVFIRK